MSPRTRRPARGFTLIELMLVVGIIGILGSIAIPEFQTLLYRSRLAERETIMRAIAKGVEDKTLNDPVNAPNFHGTWNPAGTPTTMKRNWTQASSGWKDLPVIVDGGTFCSYQFWVTEDVTQVHVVGNCDIDGDGNENQRWMIYDVIGHALVLDASHQPPAPPSNVF